MPTSAFTDAHQTLIRLLVDERKRAGILQADLGRGVGKDQSFISNIERGQRRVDVLEFYALARAMDHDPVELYAKLVEQLPRNIEI